MDRPDIVLRVEIRGVNGKVGEQGLTELTRRIQLVELLYIEIHIQSEQYHSVFSISRRATWEHHSIHPHRASRKGALVDQERVRCM